MSSASTFRDTNPPTGLPSCRMLRPPSVTMSRRASTSHLRRNPIATDNRRGTPCSQIKRIVLTSIRIEGVLAQNRRFLNAHCLHCNSSQRVNNKDKSIMSLTSTQIKLVQDSFALVAPIADTAAQLFYGRLFELDPSLRHMFKSNMKEQGLKLMQMLSVAVHA